MRNVQFSVGIVKGKYRRCADTTGKTIYRHAHKTETRYGKAARPVCP